MYTYGNEEALMADMDIDVTTARLFFNAAFPVMRTVLEDDPAMRARFKDVSGTAQITGGGLACSLVFDRGRLTVREGAAEGADITLAFPSAAKMNAMFRGGLALPAIRGFRRMGLLIKLFSLLMSLMLMMPKSRPSDPARRRLKVKMSLYMITRALSVYNKMGNPAFAGWCRRQPDRIYQFVVDPSPELGETEPVAAYLRVKAGRTKAGHGIYTRRSPFVLFHFSSVDAALKVLLKDVGFVEGVERGYVEIVGSPEYAMYLNDYMAELQGMLT